MKKYAMVLSNEVIGIVESEEIPNWPPDPFDNPVTAIACGEEVELGMIYNPETGEFSEYIPPAYVPTQLDRIEERLNLSYTEAQEQAVDVYTKELLGGGII